MVGRILSRVVLMVAVSYLASHLAIRRTGSIGMVVTSFPRSDSHAVRSVIPTEVEECRLRDPSTTLGVTEKEQCGYARRKAGPGLAAAPGPACPVSPRSPRHS